MSSPKIPTQRTLFGHPLGLYVLFITEMWERFSYYGMRGLLMLYMVNYLKWTQESASTTYKIYTSAVYITPIIGGFLADRFLGNRVAVIIGAVLMAVGHFLMAFEQVEIFYSALAFLIAGNGMFKPNMSTQVGRLYLQGDGRRDGAYTIFYMGINLGAFIAPLACGWLQENTLGGYHSGFTLAGIGMLFGLVVYLLGQPLIQEISGKSDGPKAPSMGSALTEEQASKEPSVWGALSHATPSILLFLGIAVTVIGGLSFQANAWFGDRFPVVAPENGTMIVVAGLSMIIMSWAAGEVKGGALDRVMAILMLGIFVIFFWATFEQAGNVQNIWADKNTNRYVSKTPPPPSLEAPEVHEETTEEGTKLEGMERFTKMFGLKATPAPVADGSEPVSEKSVLDSFINPIPTTWFQSINPVLIVVLAPLFASTWMWLDRKGWQPSIAGKMVLGLLLMSASMAVMWGAAIVEDRPTEVSIPVGFPAGLVVNDFDQLCIPATPDEEANANSDAPPPKPTPIHAGRLLVAAGRTKMVVKGVLPDNVRDEILVASAPADYQEKVRKFIEDAKKLPSFAPRAGDPETTPVTLTLESLPPDFDWKWAGLPASKVRYDGALTFTATTRLAEKEQLSMLVCGANAGVRTWVDELYIKADQSKVNMWWLIVSYFLATCGELCLSPVGLSMVSKLAPARFSTMLMGVWHLTSAFGNFVAGAMGEIWGRITPVEFFLLCIGLSGIAGLLLVVLNRLLTKSMHGVN